MNDAEHLALVEARRPALLHVDHELDAAPREVGLELLAHVLEELLQVHLAHEDALLAARELEHLALHGADEIELAQDELCLAFALLRGVVRALHQLHVPTDDGEGHVLEVVDDAR